MFGRVLSSIAPRRMKKRIIRKMPFVLQQKFGGARFYTVAQVRAAAEQMRLGPNLMIYATAAGCTEQAFLEAYPDETAQRYWGLREEVAEICSLPFNDFTMASLRSRPRQGWEPSMYPPYGA